MLETYTPPAPEHAVCPRCGFTVRGLPAIDGVVVFMSLMLECPACGQHWSEFRGVDGLARRAAHSV